MLSQTGSVWDQVDTQGDGGFQNNDYCYALRRLIAPKPSSADPNSHAAAGIGTALTLQLFALLRIFPLSLKLPKLHGILLQAEIEPASKI